LGPGQWDD
jgi:hypothetical protein